MRRDTVVQSVLILSALLLLHGDADAQRRRGPAGSLGVSFIAASAVGDLGTVVDRGFGLQLDGGVPVAADGHLRLRGDAGFLVYGLERLHFCGVSCRVSSELTTTNAIGFFGVGPELVLSRGPIQPYAFATAGLSVFSTSSSLDDNDGYGPYMETTNYSDVVYAVKYGGGLRLKVGGQRKPVFLDLGVERHDNGIANYLTKGDIVDEPDGSVTLFPNRSDADLVTFRLGVSFGIGG